MADVRVYTPHPLLRIWYVVVSAFLTATAAGAVIAPYFLALAACQRVELRPDRIVKRPLGGSVRFDEVKRWGRYHYRRRGKIGHDEKERDYIVIQKKSGGYVRICEQDYREVAEVADALYERVGPTTPGLRYSFFGFGLSFPD